MAVRIALFQAAPKRKAGRPAAKPRPGAAGGRRRAFARIAALLPGAAGKAGPAAATAPKPAGGGAPKAPAKAAAKPAAKPAPKPAPGSADPAAGPGSQRTARKAGPGSRAKKPKARPPVLQRRGTGPVLARAAVLAVAFVAMVAFAVALAKVTLVPSPSSDALVHTNLRPGASIRAYLDQPAVRDSVKQIGGNVLLGVPFGILLPMLFPRARGALRVIGFTAVVMVMVEAAQGLIVEGRAFDIDDVILNTLGALLGYLLLGLRLGRALHPRRTHWWHRLTRPGTRTGARPAAGRGGPGGGVTPGRRPARKRP